MRIKNRVDSIYTENHENFDAEIKLSSNKLTSDCWRFEWSILEASTVDLLFIKVNISFVVGICVARRRNKIFFRSLGLTNGLTTREKTDSCRDRKLTKFAKKKIIEVITKTVGWRINKSRRESNFLFRNLLEKKKAENIFQREKSPIEPRFFGKIQKEFELSNATNFSVSQTFLLLF